MQDLPMGRSERLLPAPVKNSLCVFRLLVLNVLVPLSTIFMKQMTHLPLEQKITGQKVKVSWDYNYGTNLQTNKFSLKLFLVHILMLKLKILSHFTTLYPSNVLSRGIPHAVSKAIKIPFPYVQCKLGGWLSLKCKQKKDFRHPHSTFYACVTSVLNQ